MLDDNLKKSLKYTLIIGFLAGIIFLFLDRKITYSIALGLLSLLIYIFILAFAVDNVIIGISRTFSYSLAYILRISALGMGLLLSYRIGSLRGLISCFLTIVLFRIFLYMTVGKNKTSENPLPYQDDEGTVK